MQFVAGVGDCCSVPSLLSACHSPLGAWAFLPNPLPLQASCSHTAPFAVPARWAGRRERRARRDQAHPVTSQSHVQLLQPAPPPTALPQCTDNAHPAGEPLALCSDTQSPGHPVPPPLSSSTRDQAAQTRLLRWSCPQAAGAPPAAASAQPARRPAALNCCTQAPLRPAGAGLPRLASPC